MANTSKVQYRQLGKSGLKVSVPILGAMSFGSDQWLPWVLNEDKALPILKAAWDRGINTWDTANAYSNGESERIIGKAIKFFNIPRHKLVILTKCHNICGDSVEVRNYGSAEERKRLRETRDYVNQAGLSRKAIFTQVEASLERLGTDYIDLLQIHRFDYETPAKETMEALNDLVRSGKVRYIGASSMWTWQLQHLNHVASVHNWTQFISMQNHHSLLYREEEREMMKYCDFAGLGVIPWGPLSRGSLARPAGEATNRMETTRGQAFEYVPNEVDQKIIGRVEETAQKKSCSMAQVAIAWSLTKVTSPIIGVSSIKRLEEAIAPDIALDENDIAYLEELYHPVWVRGHV